MLSESYALSFASFLTHMLSESYALSFARFLTHRPCRLVRELKSSGREPVRKLPSRALRGRRGGA